MVNILAHLIQAVNSWTKYYPLEKHRENILPNPEKIYCQIQKKYIAKSGKFHYTMDG